MRLALSSQPLRLAAELFQDRVSWHGTHPHRRGIPPGPMSEDGAPGAPPTPNRIRMSAEKACFFGGLCATGRQERSSGFPSLLAGRSSKTIPAASSVRSGWACRNGSGLVEFERSRCRARQLG